MANIPDEAKQELDMYFDEGIHEVIVQGVVLNTDNPEKEYLEVGVIGSEGQSADVRMYLSEKAMRYSIDTIRKIMVHNVAEDKKEAVRKAIDACKTTEELTKLAQKLEGMSCWYSKFKTGTTYTNSQGEVKNSYSNNLFGYEPKPPKHIQQAQAVQDLMSSDAQKPFDPNDFPFGN